MHDDAGAGPQTWQVARVREDHGRHADPEPVRDVDDVGDRGERNGVLEQQDDPGGPDVEAVEAALACPKDADGVLVLKRS